MTDALSKIRMYCIFSAEAVAAMKGVRGKLAAQAGHAYLHAFWDAQYRFPATAALYRASLRAYKIALVVPTADELTFLLDTYLETCGTSLVTDAGLTVFDGPTVTCLGIGPLGESMIGDDLKALKTLT